MVDNKFSFCVLVSRELVQVTEADPTWTVSSLLRRLQSPPYDLPSNLMHLKGRFCGFYALNNPIEVDEDENENEENISNIIASLQDTIKYTKVGHMKPLHKIAKNFAPNFLHLVIVDLSGNPDAVANLKQGHPDLYRCLEFKVRAPGKWTKEDVDLNDGIFVEDGEETQKPPKMIDLENRLGGKRSFSTTDNDPEFSIARRYEPQFSASYLRVDGQEIPVTVKTTREFVAFYVLLRCYYPDANLYTAASSSSLKAHALKANFILPPFFSGRSSTNNLIYQEEMPLKFPLFISCPAMSDIPRKYTPASDFSVWFRKLNLPLIVAKVISKKNEQDRCRMLIQAVSLARLAFYLRMPGSSAHPFIVAIYMTASLVVERYIVMRAESTNVVYIAQKNFILTNKDDATAFLREMYNLASELESIVDHLDSTKRVELEAIKKEATGIMSLHSGDAWTATDRITMDTIAEQPQDEDDLGVFNDDRMLTDLSEMNCKVAYVAFGHSNIAPIQSLTDGQLVGCLKFVKEGGKEIEILHYLASLTHECNHTVRPNRTWSTAGGSIIAMPVAGNRFTKLDNKDTFIWPVMKQLFEAVKFMHDHCVAHMDLKPSNLLIPSAYGALTVIDFGVSVKVKTPGQLFQSKGRIGTEGYVAPEVGHTKFSPIRADLWSAGKVVEEFCHLCRPSPCREWLLALSKELLHNDCNKRPMMSEVLQKMLNYGAETRIDDPVFIVF